MEALFAALVVALLVGILAAAVSARRWVWRPFIAGRVIVQLDSDHAVSGVLVERRGPLLVLADAKVHAPNHPPVPADGRAVIEHARVLWIQAV